jgi:hypothetical protein
LAEKRYTLGFGSHAFGSRKRRCEDNIKMELKEIRWERGSGSTRIEIKISGEVL